MPSESRSSELNDAMRRRRRFARTLLTFVIVGLALAMMRIYSRTPEYESSAVVIVRPNEFFPTTARSSLPSPLEARYDGFVQTDPIIKQAIERHDAGKIECLKRFYNPLKEFRSRLEVRSLDAAGRTIEIRFAATKPEEAEQVVTAMVEVNKEFLGDVPDYHARSSLFGAMGNRFLLSQEVKRKEHELAKFRAELPKQLPDRAELEHRRKVLAELEARLGLFDPAVDDYRRELKFWRGWWHEEYLRVAEVEKVREYRDQVSGRSLVDMFRYSKLPPTFLVSVAPTPARRTYRHVPETLLKYVGYAALCGFIMATLQLRRLES